MGLFVVLRVLVDIFILFLYFVQKFLIVNSVNPDPTPQFVVSEIGLHCSHNAPKGVSGLKRL